MIERLERLFAQLSRLPDFDAPELQAHDAADMLLLTALAEVEPPLGIGVGAEVGAGELVVIGDRHGALTLGAADALGVRDIRVHQDGLLGERALAANVSRLGFADCFRSLPLGEPLLAGAKIVVMQLPKSLNELDEIAWHIARWASPDVVLLAGGRDKHMSRSMNEVLGRSFGEVSAGRGWRKSRVLTARAPRAAHDLGEPRFAMRARDRELSFDLFAYGATFGGTSFDHGSRLLLQTLRHRPPTRDPQRVVDLGCGNGVLATAAALMWPEAQVFATDQSAAAVAATRLTAQAAGVAERVEVHRADATEAVPDGWADLVLLNPPFHSGSTVHAEVAHRLIDSTVRALAEGAQLRLVFNSHLNYRGVVEQVVGPAQQLARTPTFTVLSATRR